MKKALLYLLLFSYTTIVFKPLLPSISDTIAHIFWYSEHMATVHYEHGKYHVHSENVEAAKRNYPDKDANLPKSEVAAEHLIAADSFSFSITPFLQKRFHISSSSLLHTHLNADFLPPRA